LICDDLIILKNQSEDRGMAYTHSTTGQRSVFFTHNTMVLPSASLARRSNTA
jgi:hypothetical protein